eukprot:s1645_g12.t1
MAPKSSRKGKGSQKLPFNDDAIQKHLEAPASGDLGRRTQASSGHIDSTVKLRVPAASLRRIQGAAATIGGATGMLLGGPVSGALLGAAALYASTREETRLNVSDMSGSVARKAGSLYLKVADRACDEGVRVMDRGVEKAGAALDRGCKRLSQSSSVPAPIRAGLQQLAGDKREEPSVAPDEARKILEKHPETNLHHRCQRAEDRIPIICERSAFSTLPQISKSKFAVPGGMRAGEFKYLVQKEIKRAVPEEAAGPQPEQTIYIFINGVTPRCSTSMAELYEQHRREDGFLCVKYCAEQTICRRCSKALAAVVQAGAGAVSVIVKLPLLKQKKEELLQWCSARRLVGKGAISESGDRMPDLVEAGFYRDIKVMYDTLVCTVASSNEETVNMLVEGVAQLVRAERLMELGTSAAEALAQQPSLIESPAASGARDLTPIDVPDVGSGFWDAAGSTLQDMISNAVVTSCTALGDATNEAAGQTSSVYKRKSAKV